MFWNISYFMDSILDNILVTVKEKFYLIKKKKKKKKCWPTFLPTHSEIDG